MVFGGMLQMRYGPRRVGFAGGLLFLIGYLTGSYAKDSYPLLLLGFGVLAGAGIGLAYVCPLATGVKWFPAHKGTITGVTVAGFGLGGVFLARTGQYLLDQDMLVLSALKQIGLGVGLTVMMASLFLYTPETPDGSASHFMRLDAAFKDKRIRSFFLMMFAGTFSGLLIVGNLKPLCMSGGLSASQSTVAVMLFAVGNALGRVSWGVLHDRLGTKVLPVCMAMLIAACLGMALATSALMFWLFSVLIAFAFGGFFVLFVAEVADAFGGEWISAIYPLVFLGYGLAGLIGPMVGGEILHVTGNAQVACACALSAGVAGLWLANGYRKGARGV
jgi:OFA family oxalate/formate antiporter-like MFS transporter